MGKKAKSGLRNHFRRYYYNLFSLIYDFIIRVHSRDSEGRLRKYLVGQAGVNPGDNVLDICTGTGSAAIKFFKKVGNHGIVVEKTSRGGCLRRQRKRPSD